MRTNKNIRKTFNKVSSQAEAKSLIQIKRKLNNSLRCKFYNQMILPFKKINLKLLKKNLRKELKIVQVRLKSKRNRNHKKVKETSIENIN